MARFNLPCETVLVAAFEHSYNAMVITDADFDGDPYIQHCNPAFCAMTGYTKEELIGRSPRILQGPDTDRQLIDQLRRTIRAGDSSRAAPSTTARTAFPTSSSGTSHRCAMPTEPSWPTSPSSGTSPPRWRGTNGFAFWLNNSSGRPTG